MGYAFGSCDFEHGFGAKGGLGCRCGPDFRVVAAARMAFGDWGRWGV